MSTFDRWMNAPVPAWVILVAAVAGGLAVGVWWFVSYVDRADPEEDEDDRLSVRDGRDGRREETVALPVLPPEDQAYSPAMGISAPIARSGPRQVLYPTPCSGDGDWRDTMTRELDPARLDLEAAEQYLPGPEAPLLYAGRSRAREDRAGELHPRIIDLGQTGDDKMLTRDWFARRDWIASLWDPRWGGFELTESGHLVAVAA